MPDVKLAAKAGVAPSTVRAERERRRIPPFRLRRPRVEWSPEMVALLGTDSDRLVAEMLGLGPDSVARKRLVLQIPPHYPRPHERYRSHLWSRRELALLGKHPDKAIAARVGLSTTSVVRKRQLLGIPPYRPVYPQTKWTPRMLAALGRMSDLEVSRRFGVSYRAVNSKRRELGIPVARDVGAVVPTAELKRLLCQPSSVVRQRTGLKYDTIAKLRRQFGVRATTINELRWPQAWVKRLGKATDREIASELGLPRTRVAWKRHALGIPPFTVRRRWRPSEVALLGRLPDQQVALRVGRSLVNVRQKRRSLGIPLRK